MHFFYFPGYRISIDLDYVIYEDTENYKDIDYYASILEKVAQYLTKHYGNIFETPTIYPERGGIKVKVPIHVSKGTTPKINIDVTHGKYNKIILPPLNLSMKVAGYENVYARVMRIEEIFAEKIRALIQRTHVRDLYDIYYLQDYVDIETVTNLLEPKLETKGLTFDPSLLSERRDVFEKEYPNLMKYTKNVPPFDVVWGRVITTLKEMEENILENDLEREKEKEKKQERGKEESEEEEEELEMGA